MGLGLWRAAACSTRFSVCCYCCFGFQRKPSIIHDTGRWWPFVYKVVQQEKIGIANVLSPSCSLVKMPTFHPPSHRQPHDHHQPQQVSDRETEHGEGVLALWDGRNEHAVKTDSFLAAASSRLYRSAACRSPAIVRREPSFSDLAASHSCLRAATVGRR